MLRHGISSRSGAGVSRVSSTPQHSDGYSASACARTRASSSAVRIIRPRSPSAARESGPAAREGWPAAREGWNDRDLIAVLERGLEPLQGLDGLVVHVDVDVMVHLTPVVAHQALQATE